MGETLRREGYDWQVARYVEALAGRVGGPPTGVAGFSERGQVRVVEVC